MESMTQIELLLTGELLKVEEIAARKAAVFSEKAQDPEIRRLLGSFADAHQQKYQGLINKVEKYNGKRGEPNA